MAEGGFSSARFSVASMEDFTVAQAETMTFSAVDFQAEVQAPAVFRAEEDFPEAEAPSAAEVHQEAFKEDVYEGI